MNRSTFMAMKRIAAITAHPDDESFGLGGVISALVEGGTEVTLTCLTHGEATTLGSAEDIGRLRCRELEQAAAALDAATRRDLTVFAWCLNSDVARRLNSELNTSFQGIPSEATELELTVDRNKQIEAMNCHASQLQANPVPFRRLELQGSREYLRLLRASHNGTDPSHLRPSYRLEHQ
ncbi:MAG: hypothetical protein DCC49_00335 [Acidobacteria bacterium]|nr:MAG: hypothetical protein DCC49_00335 [Acidobacteriota bacterium]